MLSKFPKKLLSILAKMFSTSDISHLRVYTNVDMRHINRTSEEIKGHTFDVLMDQSNVMTIMKNKDDMFVNSLDKWLQELRTFTESMHITEDFYR